MTPHTDHHDPDRLPIARSACQFAETPGCPLGGGQATTTEPTTWQRGDRAVYGTGGFALAGYLDRRLPGGVWFMRPNPDLTGSGWYAEERLMSREDQAGSVAPEAAQEWRSGMPAMSRGRLVTLRHRGADGRRWLVKTTGQYSHQESWYASEGDLTRPDDYHADPIPAAGELAAERAKVDARLDPREPHPAVTLAPRDLPDPDPDPDADPLHSFDRQLRAEAHGITILPTDLLRLEAMIGAAILGLEERSPRLAMAALVDVRGLLGELAGPAIGGGAGPSNSVGG